MRIALMLYAYFSPLYLVLEQFFLRKPFFTVQHTTHVQYRDRHNHPHSDVATITTGGVKRGRNYCGLREVYSFFITIFPLKILLFTIVSFWIRIIVSLFTAKQCITGYNYVMALSH